MTFSMSSLCRSSLSHIVEHSNQGIYLQWTSPQFKESKLHPFIPELQLQQLRVVLYFLVPSGVAYVNSTNDPWFSATTGTGLGRYRPDEPATVLGCASSLKFCNPKLPAAESCLDFWHSREEEFERVFPDIKDRMVVRPLMITSTLYTAGGIYNFYLAKSVPSLLARETLQSVSPHHPYQAVQTKPLSSDQWQKEIEYVSQAFLAAMQHSFVDYARGSWYGGEHFCDIEPCRRICHSQVC